MTNAIKGYLMSDNHLISSKSIDNILLNYYDSNDLTLKLYILDLKVSVGHSYSILSDTMLDCSTSYSLGSKSYLYLDLHATCSKFGPKTVGEGQVLPNLIPSLSSNNNNNNNSLIVQLQNFIHHSIHYLLSPSLAYYPLNLFNSLHVNIIIIKDHTSTPYNLDNTIDSLKAKLSSIPLLKGQKTIEFNTFTYTTLDCDYCASVLSHSMKHYQSPSPSFAEFHLNHKSYLDSKELYYWLSHFNTFFVPESTNSVTVLPIYIFSLSQHTSSPPLLDKKHQAVSFEDMVVAVHSDSSSYYLDYVCNTHIVSVDPSKLEVPLVSASIQSIWGVPASYKSWNLVHNKSIENYLWTLHPYSLGSPFINSIQIHPLLKDIALRNLLYTNLHIALDEVNHLFSHFEEYDKEVSEVLSSSELVQFVRRWNLFQFKVENAKKYLSLNNYNSSLAFIKSLDYDIISLHNLIHSAGNKLYTYLYCEEEKTISATTFSLVNFTKILIVLSPILVMIYVFVSFSKTILFVHSSK